MKPADLTRLIVLAAIWGGSFIFMRVVAPVLGPAWTAGLRLTIAGVALLTYFQFIRFAPGWREHFRHYLVVGALNSALPFFLFAYAAQRLPASLSAILNSTTPLFGAVFAALWLGDALTAGRLTGLLLGIGGVALASWRPGTAVEAGSGLAMAACLLAACSYGLAATYLKKFARHVPPLGLAGCSQMLAGLILLAGTPLAPAHGAPTALVIACLLGLALLCSALAYVLFYRLVADIGPAKTLTVTFLIPIFGILWGVLFLGEHLTLAMVAGCATIIAGTALVVRPKPTAK